MDIKQILREQSFRFNKQFGQNFITDNFLLDGIVADSGLTSADNVLEIGAGAGTLTRRISRVANKVVALEVDNNLRQVLDITLADCKNASYVMADVMKMTPDAVKKLMDNKPYKVVANIPYYITTPIIMMFADPKFGASSLTLTIQKEVALRLAAKEGTKDYGAISVAVQSVADVEVTRIIDKTMFYPVPKVDSAVVNIVFRDKYGVVGDECFRKTVKCAFAMRRKTLLNNLLNGFEIDKQQCIEILEKLNVRPDIRGEALSVEQFVKLSKLLKGFCNSKS